MVKSMHETTEEDAAAEAAETRAEAIKALPASEIARFVAQSAAMIRELVAEAEWRNIALHTILERLDADENDNDELRDAVYHIYEIWWSLGDFVLEGRGLDGGYHRRSPDTFQLDPDRVAALRVRLTKGPRR